MFASFWYHIKDGSAYGRKKNENVNLLTYLSHYTYDPLSSKSWFPIPHLKRIPLEPIIKMALPGIGIFAENFISVQTNKNGTFRLAFTVYKLEMDPDCAEFIYISRLVHISLYLAFFISGLVDILAHYFRLPSKTSPLFLCFALYIEAHLFISHGRGSLPFRSAVHDMVLIFIVSAAVFSTLRILNPRNLLINSGLAGSMILQATHLYQAAFATKQFNPFSHMNATFIEIALTWHLLSVGFFMLMIYMIMSAVLSQRTNTNHYKLLASASNGSNRHTSKLTSWENDSLVLSDSDSPEPKNLQTSAIELKTMEGNVS